MIRHLEGKTWCPIGTADGFWQAVRLKSILSAYGTGYDFFRFYLQKESGALLCKIGEDGILYPGDGRFQKELADFIRLNGIRQLSVAGKQGQKLAACLPDADIRRGTVLVRLPVKEPPVPFVMADCMGLYQRGYRILCAAFPSLSEADFDAWYCDLSHRVRHRTAGMFLLEDTACAVFLQDGEDLFLDKLAVLPQKQGEGIGSKLLRAVAGQFTGCRMAVYSENSFTDRFYLKNGFQRIGEWQEYLLK